MPTGENGCRPCGRAFLLTMTVAEQERMKGACPKCPNRTVDQRFSARYSRTGKKG